MILEVLNDRGGQIGAKELIQGVDDASGEKEHGGVQALVGGGTSDGDPGYLERPLWSFQLNTRNTQHIQGLKNGNRRRKRRRTESDISPRSQWA